MEKATFVYATYEDSSSRTHHGSRKSIQRFIDNGYYVKEARNGFYVLVKPARIIAVFKDTNGELYHFDIKQDILEFYGKERISKSLFEKFQDDASKEVILFYLDDDHVVNLGN